jgi:SAM-dependent methyltransferase
MPLKWSEITKHRKKLLLKKLPVISRNPMDMWDLVEDHIGNNDTVLDVGASRAEYRKRVPKSVKYYTMDVDPDVKVDYRSLRGINRKFDDVLMLNVVEHLTIKELERYADDIRKILKPDGKLIIWTHNVAAIPDITHHDFSHVQHYPVADLYGILNLHGYELDGAYRVVDNRGLKRIRNILKRILCLILEADYAWGILLVVKRKK